MYVYIYEACVIVLYLTSYKIRNDKFKESFFCWCNEKNSALQKGDTTDHFLVGVVSNDKYMNQKNGINMKNQKIRQYCLVGVSGHDN